MTQKYTMAEVEQLEQEYAELLQQKVQQLKNETKERSVIQNPTTVETTMAAGKTDLLQFNESFCKKHNISGKPYEQFIREKFE